MSPLEFISTLSDWLCGATRVVIAGVGNTLRRDDGLGPEFVKRLIGLSGNIMVLDCGSVPESYVGPIRRFKPSHILIVDAADMGLPPGSFKLVYNLKIPGVSISTHSLPINFFTEYLESQTSAKTALLMIQPKDTTLGEGLSTEVEDTVNTISKIVRDSLRKLYSG
ncbi:hydrogenase maturation peptidase HycI [Candidatus Bathyarchaeota archaeon]|nr:hydrogenase maturation peptidase HycI [Candidatus Bathyarchaeota archaeon]